MRAVITAGAPIDGEYAREAGTSIKALAPVRGKTMLARAVEAARGAGIVQIAVIGGDEIRAAFADRVERIVDAAPSGSENVMRALSAWPHDDALLYLTSDLPYVDAGALSDFLARSANRLTIALASHESFERRFPDAPPFGIRIGRERVVNGGAFHVPAAAAGHVGGLAARFFEARKHPLQMARIAGPDLLARFVLGQLSIDRLERRAAAVLGMEVAAVRDCAPELAFDADEPDEYRYACTHA